MCIRDSYRVITNFLRCFFLYIVAGIVSHFVHNVYFRNVWLVAERGVDARDNGYHFFRFLNAEHPEINSIYIMDRSSADTDRIAKIGKYVGYGSFKHYILLHKADYLISTHIMGFTPCPELFLDLEKRTKFRLKGKKVFLQHGIIKDKQSGLMADTVNLDLFICGAKPEYDYIKKNFGFKSGVVQYTGLARYDALPLNQTTKKQILVMPTWRKWLNGLSKEKFVQTEYYKQYSELLSNEKLINHLREGGWNIVFYPHFEFQKFSDTFEGNDVVTIADFTHFDVQELLIESRILVTDYSSVCFDFCYMGKTVIFFQFDKEDFSKNHRCV